MKIIIDILDVIVFFKDDFKGIIVNFFFLVVMLFICIFCCKVGRNICECIKFFFF